MNKVVLLEIKKENLRNRINDLERHHRLIRALIDTLHTERVTTEQELKKISDKIQSLAEQIDEINYKEESK